MQFDLAKENAKRAIELQAPTNSTTVKTMRVENLDGWVKDLSAYELGQTAKFLNGLA